MMVISIHLFFNRTIDGKTVSIFGRGRNAFFQRAVVSDTPPPAVHLVTVNNEGDLTFSI